ncbi:MAG: hypothetical protein WC381_03880 [Kiritimatiellia bacterium]
MSKIISMQDMRLSLASIANQAQSGETFIVVRSSKPVFKIIPPFEKIKPAGKLPMSLAEITDTLDAVKACYDLSENDLDGIIHEAHAEYGRK